MSEAENITLLLNTVRQENSPLPAELLELVYKDLRRLARAYLKNERSNHTLQPTALVHEAFIRVSDWKNVAWENRAQFFAVVSQIMRHILVDYARSKNAQKRAAGQKILLDDAVSFPDKKEIDLLRLDEALQSLEKLDPRQSKIIELRFFGGLSVEETAHVLKISETTVKREWRFAKTWLQRELQK
jgi:RNA polymerase sigma-70 factor (ECF subfamily)